MKLTKKTVKHEVETTEVLCEISRDEFDKICAESAAHTIVDFMGDNPDTDDLTAGVSLTALFAKFAAAIGNKLFTDSDTNENPDKKEEK